MLQLEQYPQFLQTPVGSSSAVLTGQYFSRWVAHELREAQEVTLDMGRVEYW